MLVAVVTCLRLRQVGLDLPSHLRQPHRWLFAFAKCAEICYTMLSQIEKGLQSRVSGNPYTCS